MFHLTIQDSNGEVVSQVSFDQGSFVLGRMETCDIPLNSNSVSRKHARVFVHNGRCYIEDLGSANGITVDGQRVIGRRDLGTASQLRIGDYALFLEYQRPGLTQEQRVLQTVFIPRDADHSKLVRIYDSFAGEEFVLSETDNTIGRTDENFILLSDRSISRHHARIIRDGDRYTVMDLDSSNGTTLNGKKVTNPQYLQLNDQVKFGNIEFLFVHGDTRVDLTNYRTPPNKNARFIQAAGIISLILVGVCIGGAILYGMNRLKDNDEPKKPAVEAPKTPTVEDRVATLLGRAEKAAERHDWDQAISLAKEVTNLAPDQAEAAAIKERAEREREADATLERGENLSEKGELREALQALEEIPPKTRAYERSRPTIEHVKRTLAYNLKSEGIRLQRKARGRRTKQNMLAAHRTFVESLQLYPGDTDLLSRTRALERDMRKKRYKFTAYKP